MNHETYTFETRDGLSLFAQVWTPETLPVAEICLIHGLGEHSCRYDHLVQALNHQGQAVRAFDLRGHGRSQGQRGSFPTYEALMDDLDDFLTHDSERFSGLPRLYYGHSMGGNLVLNHLIRRRPPMRGAVVSAPLLRIAFEAPAWKQAFGALLQKVWPSLSIANELDPAWLSRDPHVQQSYRDDPLSHNRITPRFYQVLQAGEWCLQHASDLQTPILLMHGDQDHITSVDASREFSSRAGDLCELTVWPGLYHELHNEPEQDKVIQTAAHWLYQQVEKVGV